MRVASYRAPNFVFTEHEFELPLDHAQPDGPTITVFAREVVTPAHERDDRPWLVFLQGGPGFEAPRLLKLIDETWWERALQDYRLLLLDQRGTGPYVALDCTPLDLDKPAGQRRCDRRLGHAGAFYRTADSVLDLAIE